MEQKTLQSSALVIIGSGLAGYTLAREVRKLDKIISITLVTKEPGYFYSKPMLSTALAGKKEALQLITSSAEAMANQLEIHLLAETEVGAIDTAKQIIQTSQGAIAYQKLVLALGADQIRIPLEGDAVNAVHTVNDLEDYAKFRDALNGKKHVAILGAGLIGCEFANDLILSAYAVDVIDLAPQALGRLLPEAAAQVLQAKLSQAGVNWHFSTTIQSINRKSDGLEITLSNGHVITCDAVLSAVGLKPRLDLAKAAGIETGIGITVDRELKTSAPNVYSLGDCAEVEGLVLPYVMPIMQAARALAPTLIGQPTPVSYPAMPVMVKTPSLPTIISPPAKGSDGEWRVQLLEDSVEVRFESPDGRLLGFVLMGSATSQRASLTKELPAILN